MTDKKRTTVFFGETERKAIKKIRERYGIESDISVIRLALKVLADADYLVLSSEPKPIDTQDANVVS